MRLPLVLVSLLSIVVGLTSGCETTSRRIPNARTIGEQLSDRLDELVFEMERVNMRRTNPVHIRPPLLIRTGEGLEDWRPDYNLPRRDVTVVLTIDETGGLMVDRMQARGLSWEEQQALRRGLERMKFYSLQIDGVSQRVTIECKLEV